MRIRIVDSMRGVDLRQTAEFTPTPAELAWTFGGVDPTMTLKPGTAVRLWTEDAFSGCLSSSSDLPSANLVSGRINPQTGPFFVAGAQPGDTLVLHFAEI